MLQQHLQDLFSSMKAFHRLKRRAAAAAAAAAEFARIARVWPSKKEQNQRKCPTKADQPFELVLESCPSIRWGSQMERKTRN